MTEVKRYYFEDGNTVRVTSEPLPSREERELAEKKRRREARRKKERRKKAAMAQSRLHTLMLCSVAGIACLFFMSYVYLQAETQDTMASIASLEGEISSLKADNAAEQNRISASENLSQVKDVAQNQLGMVYAGNGQIVYYTVEESDYMTQYQDVN